MHIHRMKIKSVWLGQNNMSPQRTLFFRKTVQLMLAAVVIAAFSSAFKNQSMQHISWTFPYFSGAANYETLFDWRISPTEFDKIEGMSDNAHREYRYVATEKTVQSTVNEYGYVLVALAARHLFPGLSDIQGVILLQILVHIILSLFVMGYLLESRLQRGLFFILYAINPLVLHVVTFPFYYFWTVLPSVALAIVWFKPNQRCYWVPVTTIVLLFALLIRPTTIFIALFVFAVAFMRDSSAQIRRITACFFLCFMVGAAVVYHHAGQRSLFHTVYIGVGAYSNPYGISLDDVNGFNYYKQTTGTAISTHPIQGNWGVKKVQQDYNETLKQRYLQIFHQSPMLLIRNALLNTVQAFGVGYDVQRPWSRPITVLMGVFIICLFVVTRQWIWMAAIFIYSASFTLFFPPIPAYLFGAYLLLILGISAAVEQLVQRLYLRRAQGWGYSF